MALLVMAILTLSGQGLAAEPVEDALLRHTNEVRASYGLPGLAVDAGLAAAARAHAQEMALLGYFAHESPSPARATLRQRLAIAGVPSALAAENLAWLKGDFDVPQASVQSWLDSPSHREVLLGRSFTHAGFGVAVAEDGSVYVAQVVARQPRRLLAVAVQPQADGRTEVELSYQEAPGELAVFVDGEHYRDGLAGPSTVRLVLTRERPRFIAVGEVVGEMMIPFDHFTLESEAGRPRLIAGDGRP